MEKPVIKIFARKNSSRLNYILAIILGDILGLSWETVTDRRKIGKHPVISYSPEKIQGALWIDPASLLFEPGISKFEIVAGRWKDLPVFFTTEANADIPFDIFAASFYIVTRYEEYLDHKPDEHGRFRASSSLAYRNGFLDMPVIDLWVKEFAKLLVKKFPVLAIRRNEFRASLTIDTDEPFAYLGKNVIRSVGGLLHDLTKNRAHASERYKVVTHEKKDPYQVFDYITETIKKNEIDTRFFFPVGDHSKYDNNPSWKNEEYRALINTIMANHTVGLHPSYVSATDFNMIEKELSHLKNISSADIISSRFHFLRLFMPLSYNYLLKAGIREDHSMGYPDEPGFRAGIARPFHFYDVNEDRPTGLKIFPFQVMDVTLYDYKKLNPSSGLDIIRKLIAKVRSVGGLFTSIWHNTSLLETEEWKDWRMVFEMMLLDCRQNA